MADVLLDIQRNATNQIVEVAVINNSNGRLLTGVINTEVIVDYWKLGSAGAHTNKSPIVGDGLVDSYEENKWKEVDATFLPGIYQYSVPDGAFAVTTAPTIFIVFDISKANAQDFVLQNNFPETNILKAGLDLIIMEQGLNLTEGLRCGLSSMYGRTQGVKTTAPIVQSPLGTVNRITATLDANGNRTAITLDGSEDV